MGKHISLSNYRKDPYYPRIVKAAREILRVRAEVSPIDVFMGMGLLDKKHVENWRAGRIPYLERVIQCNLAKASRILRILRFHAHDLNLEAKVTTYSRKKTGPLRFSKTGDPNLEEAYRRHFCIIGNPDKFRSKHGLLPDLETEDIVMADNN